MRGYRLIDRMECWWWSLCGLGVRVWCAFVEALTVKENEIIMDLAVKDCTCQMNKAKSASQEL